MITIDKNWTLFLDRDGVINKRIEGYIQRPEQLELIDGVLETLAKCSKIFRHIFIVTNQQGIGKKLMTIEDLNRVHTFLLEKIKSTGGRIDQIYYAPELATDPHSQRKPNIHLGLRAKKDFPDLDFHKAIMVGDFPSDLLFGQRLHMKTIWIPENEQAKSGIEPNEIIPSLAHLFEVISVKKT